MDSSQWLILGNGFDLQAGLKSTFADFYKRRYYLNNLNENNSINHNWEDNLLKNKKQSSVWDLLICTYLENNFDSLQNWKDVESVIKEILQGVHGTNVHFYDNIFQDAAKVIPISWQFRDMIDGASVLNTNEKHALRDYWLSYYIIEKLVHSYPNFKDYVSEKTDFGDSENFILSLSAVRSILSPLLLKELKKFESAFSEYLDEQLSSDTGYVLNATKLYKIIADDPIISTQVLSFNYTPKISNDILIYRNIHGSLKDKNIIFGIDASDNENGKGFDPYLVKFTKTSRILKLTNNSITNIKEDWNGQSAKITSD